MASVTGVLQAVSVPPLVGAAVLLEDRWSPAASLNGSFELQATFFGGPDVLLDQLLDEATRRGIVSVPIASVFLGGAALDPHILQRVESEFGIVVMPAYGSSEAPISTSGTRDEPADVRLSNDGRPLQGVEIRIGSHHHPGECCISGPHLFLGYFDPEDDAGAFEPDDDREWYLTGDVGQLQEGRLKIVGRIKDLVIRKGQNISPVEVESAVGAIAGIEQAACFGVPDPETGERLVVAVRTADGTLPPLETLTNCLVNAGLPKWKLPEEVVLWDEPFPETGTGRSSVRHWRRARLVGRAAPLSDYAGDGECLLLFGQPFGPTIGA